MAELRRKIAEDKIRRAKDQEAELQRIAKLNANTPKKL